MIICVLDDQLAGTLASYYDVVTISLRISSELHVIWYLVEPSQG